MATPFHVPVRVKRRLTPPKALIALRMHSTEAPIEGADKKSLAAAIAAHGHRHAIPLPAPEKLAPLVHSIAKPGDFVVLLGAGSITQWAYALPGELAALNSA